MALFSEIWRYLLAWLGRNAAEWNTAGPKEEDHPPSTVEDLIEMRELREAAPPWSEGRWLEAEQKPAHPGRIGLPIVPQAVVVHTTDMYPGTFKAIVRSWTSQRGKGNAAHFLIGRSEADGVVQFAPINRNANHAGGKTCGYWKSGTRRIHPNTISVGIELDCAGKLKQRADGGYYHPDTGKAIPVADVYFDSKGKPWHKVTEYQLYTLRRLLDDLTDVLKAMPDTYEVAPSGDYLKNGVGYYARNVQVRPWLVGHVTLDPINKLDPGPQVMEWLRKEYP